MAVYAVCETCKCRRDACPEQSAHKHKVGWVADCQLQRNGKRLRKTFGSDVANPKALADAQERQWRTDFERGALMPKKTAAVALSVVAAEWWAKVAIGQARIKDPKRSEKSRFESVLRLFGDKLLADDVPDNDNGQHLTLDCVEQWVTDRLEAGIAVNTINRDLKPLRWILKYAVEKRYLKASPVAGLKSLKGGNVRVRWLSEREIGLLVEAAYAEGDEALVDLIAVGLNTGFRKGNLERLEARDIGDALITAQKTKSGNPYDVPISPDIAPILRRLMHQKPTGPLLSTGKLDARFRIVARAAGLYPAEEVEDGKKDPNKVTIHTLRHTFAALYLKRGGDIYKLSKLMGHASVRITEAVYGHLCPKDMAAQAPLISTPISLRSNLKIA